MDDSIWSFLHLIFLAAGVYTLYAYILIKTKGEVKTQFLLGKDIELRKCKDLEGYKNFIAPRMLAFAVGCIVYGAIGMINSFVMEIPNIFYWIIMTVFFVLIIWFAVQTKKSVEKFW